MFVTATIETVPPLSGDYPETIYDVPLSTGIWTWVRFEDEDNEVHYGQFQGQARTVALSASHPYVYVLTDTFLYEVNRTHTETFLKEA
ncbi:MAG: hypothetical protein KBT36_17400 [Kurthia sp.]|nr:hypothetical protein [Candidatus Kurthia equi]